MLDTWHMWHLVELFDFITGTNVIKSNHINMTNCDYNVTFDDVGILK